MAPCTQSSCASQHTNHVVLLVPVHGLDIQIDSVLLSKVHCLAGHHSSKDHPRFAKKMVIIVTVKRFPAHDELGMCRTGLGQVCNCSIIDNMNCLLRLTTYAACRSWVMMW